MLNQLLLSRLALKVSALPRAIREMFRACSAFNLILSRVTIIRGAARDKMVGGRLVRVASAVEHRMRIDSICDA
jgi:hypothetical protein